MKIYKYWKKQVFEAKNERQLKELCNERCLGESYNFNYLCPRCPAKKRFITLKEKEQGQLNLL